MMTIGQVSDDTISRYPAALAAGQSSELSFQSSGLIESLDVSEAQTVTKGQTIASLQKHDFVSNASSAKSQLDVAQEEYLRAVNLLKENAIARSVEAVEKLQIPFK